MTNRFKFRAWHKENKKMFPVDDIFWSIKGKVEIVSAWLGDEEKDETFNARADEVILIQFTGLSDKNGKEIFEGDVLATSLSHRGFVEWGYAGFLVRFPETSASNTFCSPFSALDLKQLEIIGNVWENKELLNDH